MQRKKLYLLGCLVLVLIGVGAYSVAGSSLQGRFSIGAKYDLAVTDVSVGEDGLLTVTVKNNSKTMLGGLSLPSSATNAGYTYIYIDDMSKAAMAYEWKNLDDQAFFKEGGVSTLEPTYLDDWTYQVKACVDATSVLTETDETNNCLTKTIVPSVSTSTDSE